MVLLACTFAAWSAGRRRLGDYLLDCGHGHTHSYESLLVVLPETDTLVFSVLDTPPHPALSPSGARGEG